MSNINEIIKNLHYWCPECQKTKMQVQKIKEFSLNFSIDYWCPLCGLESKITITKLKQKPLLEFLQ